MRHRIKGWATLFRAQWSDDDVDNAALFAPVVQVFDAHGFARVALSWNCCQ